MLKKPFFYNFSKLYFCKNTPSCSFEYMLFLISNTVRSNTRLKLVKNQANAKQHHEAELLLFEHYSHSSCENNRTYSQKSAKVKVFLNSWDYTINHNENKDENEK